MLPPIPRPTANTTIQSCSNAADEVVVSRATGFMPSVPVQEATSGSEGAGIAESMVWSSDGLSVEISMAASGRTHWPLSPDRPVKTPDAVV